MFAYDTNITISDCTFAELEQATNSELINLYSWLKANKLSLNIARKLSLWWLVLVKSFLQKIVVRLINNYSPKAKWIFSK